MTKKEIEDFLESYYSENTTNDELVAKKLGINLDELHNFSNNFAFEADQISANNKSKYRKLISIYADSLLNNSKK